MDKLSLDITEFEFVEEKEGESNAAVSLNPSFTWCKFILTDDKPNLNKERIPLEEFDNLIKTGINAPIKMSESRIGDHPTSIPLGVITALVKENNYIKGLAALWSQERPEDVQMIKDRYQQGLPLNLSWEVIYSGKEEEPDGIVALKNTALRATTFVKLPAYGGRTPVLEVASVQNESNSEDNKLEELEQLRTQLADLQTQYDALVASVSEKDATIATLEAEKQALAEFKEQVESEKLEAEKFSSIKLRFKEAGLEKPDTYFDEKKETLMNMSESALDFMIQELVSFASQLTNHSNSSVVIPNLPASTPLSPKDVGRKLRETK